MEIGQSTETRVDGREDINRGSGGREFFSIEMRAKTKENSSHDPLNVTARALRLHTEDWPGPALRVFRDLSGARSWTTRSASY